MEGRISISRTNQNKISIEIEDELSSKRFVRLEMTPEAFGNAVTGFSYQPIEFSLSGVEVVGKKLEVKREYITMRGFEYFKGDFLKGIALYEIDGWRADMETSYNHYRQKPQGYEVTFRRWVDIPDTKE